MDRPIPSFAHRLWTGVLAHPSLASYLPASQTVYNEIVPPHIPTPVETSKIDGVSSLRSSIPDLTLVLDLYDHLHDLSPPSLLADRLKLPELIFKLADLSLPSTSDAESNVRVYLLGDVEIKTSADLSEERSTSDPSVDQSLHRPGLFVRRRAASFDLPTRALRLLVRLWQPFGGLLLASTGCSQYRRVVTDSLIVVRLREDAPLSELRDAVQTVQIR